MLSIISYPARARGIVVNYSFIRAFKSFLISFHTMPFFDVDNVVKKTNRMWFSVVCTLIANDTRHHSGQNVVDKTAQTMLKHIRFAKCNMVMPKGLHQENTSDSWDI